MPGPLLNKGVTLSDILETFMKEYDAVAASWEPELCCWLERGLVSKPWR